MSIDCELENNKIVRRDLTAMDEKTYFVNDGIIDISNDVGKKSYKEIDGNCVCKKHPTGQIGADLHIKTLEECADSCKTLNNCVIFLHSST